MGRAAIIGVLAVASNCGGSRADLCHRQVEQACDEQVRCNQGGALQVDRSKCELELATFLGCAALENLSCPDDDLSPSYDCLHHNAATPVCGDVRPGQCDFPTLPQLATCTTSDGTVACVTQYALVTGSNGRCSLTLDDCTDAHTYVATCDAQGCTCAVDGTTTASTAETGLCDTATVDARCGWTLR